MRKKKGKRPHGNKYNGGDWSEEIMEQQYGVKPRPVTRIFLSKEEVEKRYGPLPAAGEQVSEGNNIHDFPQEVGVGGRLPGAPGPN